MILGQVTQYTRRPEQYGHADSVGAAVALHDVVGAALQFKAVDEVHFFLDSFRASAADAGAALHDLRRRFGHDTVRMRSILELENVGTEDLVFHTPTDNFVQLALARAAAGGRFPIACLVHTIPSPRFLLHYVGTLLLARPYDAVVVSTDAGRRALMSMLDVAAALVAGPTGARVDRAFPVMTVPFGVDPAPFARRDRLACRRELHVPDDAAVLLWVGRLTEAYKADLEPLLNVFSELLAESPNAYLFLAGSDTESYGDAIQSRAAAYGIPAARLKVLTNFPYALKPVVYGCADIFVSPVDNVQETFGLAVIEAMASGLPVVASDWSGYRELVVHGVTGLLAPTRWNAAVAERLSASAPLAAIRAYEHALAEATVVDMPTFARYVATLIRDPELRGRMASAGRERMLNRFTAEHVTARLEALWSSQIEASRSASAHAAAPVVASFNEVFRHFATAPLEADVRLTCSPSGSRLAHTLSEASRDALPPWMSSDRAAAILRACERDALPLCDLAGSDGLARTVTWLYKKHHLQPAPEAHDTACAATTAPRSDAT